MDENEIAKRNQLYSEAIIDQLIKSGIRNFCIAPGSRNSALSIAVAENRMAEKVIHFDERSLGFVALGMAKAVNSPACIIVTSGSALTNLYPAILEAAKDDIPLLILSADRPASMRETRSNQCIDQVKIFGNYLTFEFDLPIQDQTFSLENLQSLISHASYKATFGPALINCQFTKPFFLTKKKAETHPKRNNSPQTKILPHTKNTPQRTPTNPFARPSQIQQRGYPNRKLKQHRRCIPHPLPCPKNRMANLCRPPLPS